MSIETLIIGIVVVAAAVYSGRLLYRNAIRKSGCCGTSPGDPDACKGCAKYDRCPPEIKINGYNRESEGL